MRRWFESIPGGQQKGTMKNSEVIDKLVPIYIEVEDLGERAKEILAEAKKAGLDNTTLAAVAKAKAKDKLEDLKDKTDALQAMLSQV
jgi:uncharacterized protein (UPF0335 family)